MGTLNIVGIGPGDPENMTQACLHCLQSADIIVGYTGYVKLVQPLFPNKAYLQTGMMQEVDRCRAALELAEEGKTVCVVSSGDSGVYGMASLILELAGETPSVNIRIIPGVTAALSGAALLGAPIGHDFAVVSLSDLLTPWEIIERRLRAAAMGDFAICLYNPSSQKRADYLQRACHILLEHMPETRLCGVAGNIGRDGQYISLMTLGELCEMQLGMTDTVFIGNTQTRRIHAHMVTPRGYSLA